MNGLIPKIKRVIDKFIYSENGKINKSSVIRVALVISATLFSGTKLAESAYDAHASVRGSNGAAGHYNDDCSFCDFYDTHCSTSATTPGFTCNIVSPNHYQGAASDTHFDSHGSIVDPHVNDHCSSSPSNAGYTVMHGNKLELIPDAQTILSKHTHAVDSRYVAAQAIDMSHNAHGNCEHFSDDCPSTAHSSHNSGHC